jgi:iron(III) transport system substrate-binding protein
MSNSYLHRARQLFRAKKALLLPVIVEKVACGFGPAKPRRRSHEGWIPAFAGMTFTATSSRTPLPKDSPKPAPDVIRGRSGISPILQNPRFDCLKTAVDWASLSSPWTRGIRSWGIAIFLGLLLLSCGDSAVSPEVVVYTSVDQPHAEPVLLEFEERSGIRVRAVYDVEASKTTGLVQRLDGEKAAPKADVYWSSEIIQTLWLEDRGVLAPYLSPQAGDIPGTLKDPEGYWTGIGLRGRVILVNKDRVRDVDVPSSIFEFLDPQWASGDVGVANPLFGTTFTHAAVLYSVLGEHTARDYFRALKEGPTQILDGNSTVRDRVASGDLMVGLTDTDDARAALRNGAPVSLVFPVRVETGALFIPGTVALVAGGPNQDNGKRLVDFLLSPEAEKMLIDEGFFHDSVRSPPVPMDIDWDSVADLVPQVRDDLKEIFLR